MHAFFSCIHVDVPASFPWFLGFYLKFPFSNIYISLLVSFVYIQRFICILPPNGLLEEYEKLIFQNSEDSVDLNRTIFTSDLATLSIRSWLSLPVIQGVLDIINSLSSDTRAFILNNLIGLKGSALQKLVETKW